LIGVCLGVALAKTGFSDQDKKKILCELCVLAVKSFLGLLANSPKKGNKSQGQT